MRKRIRLSSAKAHGQIQMEPLLGDNTRGARGWCLEVHDLAIAKYVAGRGKDILFTKALAKHGMTRRNVLGERLTDTKINDVGRRLAEARIAADFAGL